MCSEFDLIQRYFKKSYTNAILGIGDDAALIAVTPGHELALSTDTLVSGRHFFADADPYQLGYKSLAVNLSDMAAMGAKPRWIMLALTLPEALAKHSGWLAEFSKGFFELADRHQVQLIGGDTTAGPLAICVQITGEVAAGQGLRRSGARPGDDIWVSGRLGSAALALKHETQQIILDPDERAHCLPALLMPVARVELGQRLTGLAHSAIDVSDGLLADLGHILESSEQAACIHLEDIPCAAELKKRMPQPAALQCLLAGGDDYELCFTAPKIHREPIDRLAAELILPLTRIGEIVAGEGLIVKDALGNRITMEINGYDHFRA
ncbi:thiamine-phosphate kinase [Nitrosomonas sp. sh817]|uniref:thiamine-phosphate kinase n=1 Tax=Nitrosomonas sp. sh817 TaxID=3070658 RepID=UPI0027DE74C9|nr:thiamine-phosphate kinase [Nitrosomonas sp. sh817]WMJ08107.1 thiamine-phosphate kinase [Nitrosomonas sp. sh817]